MRLTLSHGQKRKVLGSKLYCEDVTEKRLRMRLIGPLVPLFDCLISERLMHVWQRPTMKAVPSEGALRDIT